MQIKHVLSALLFVFTLCFFGSNAFAQAAEEGFDARVGLSGNIINITTDISTSLGSFESDKNADYAGLAGKLMFGYRWEYVGVYIDQELGGVWYDGDSDYINDVGHFIGGTFLVGRGIYPVSDSFMIDLGLGIGVMYAAGDSPTKYDGNPEDYVAPLIINKDGDPSAAFAIKLSFSLDYYFTDMIGIGIYVDYNYAFKTLERGGSDITYNYHVVNPGIQVLARF